jgi:hypothetical protein
VLKELADLGEHRVKDFPEPVWIYQLGQDRFPPLKTISMVLYGEGRVLVVEDALALALRRD